MGGPGPDPLQNPSNPWPGTCPHGGVFTSGFEGPWTTTPLQWSNQYFQNLLSFNWEQEKSPANHTQYRPSSSSGSSPKIMMLVSDISLIRHDFYRQHVEEFARNLSSLEYEFARAWYHLASHDMGPHSRCIGPFVLPPQSWQHPLPPPSSDPQPNFDDVKKQILAIMRPTLPHPALQPDYDGKSLYYGAAFIKLAWQCAATFRRTDYNGGCNGARVRLPPQSQWDVNKGMDAVLNVLQPVKDMFPKMSWADLIVYASHVAIEESAAAASAQAPKPFCPGRTDASADQEQPTSLQVGRTCCSTLATNFQRRYHRSPSSATRRLTCNTVLLLICSDSPCVRWLRCTAVRAARPLRACRATVAAGAQTLLCSETSFT
jgi:catalase-peroxidase